MEVIKVEEVSKCYKLYNNKTDRLKEAIHPFRKRYSKDFYALTDVNFSLDKGETVGILGKNGSGKSTLLKILTGVIQQTTGKVNVEGKISALLELGAGFNPEYTGIENIYFNASLMGFSKEKIDSKLENVLSFADIGDFVYQPVKTYSSGMFARLAFAVSINVEPDIFIIDEALSVGDVFFQQKCFEKIRQLKDTGVTILFVSHDVSSVSSLCDRCLLLNEGVLVSKGLPRTIINDYIRINNTVSDVVHTEPQVINKEKLIDNEIEEYRYGDKTAIITSVEFESPQNKDWIVYTLESFNITVKVEFLENCENPIVAFYIKNKKGLEMYSGNTFYLNNNIGKVKKGQKITVEFTQNMYLSPDDYIVSIGLSDYIQGISRPLDRRYDLYKLTVRSNRQIIGLIDMDSKVNIKVEA